MDRGALGTSGVWRTQVDQVKVYSRASRSKEEFYGLEYRRFQLMVVPT